MDDMRNGVCALCGHPEVLECRPKSRGYRSAYNAVVAAVVDPGFFSFDKEVGEVLLYACRKCGFSQTFVSEAGSIPVGKQYGTRIVRKKARATDTD